jgi:hypothetical protein
MGLGCVWGVMVWLVVRRMVSMVIGLVFRSSVGTNVGVMMIIAMLEASGMYGLLLWLWRDSVVGCAFDSFSSS